MDKFTSQKIIKDIDLIKKSLASVDKTLALQAESLKEHMRRSLLNEQAVEVLKEELKPVTVHVSVVNIIVKVLAWLLGSGLVLFLIEKFL